MCSVSNIQRFNEEFEIKSYAISRIDRCAHFLKLRLIPVILLFYYWTFGKSLINERKNTLRISCKFFLTTSAVSRNSAMLMRLIGSVKFAWNVRCSICWCDEAGGELEHTCMRFSRLPGGLARAFPSPLTRTLSTT